MPKILRASVLHCAFLFRLSCTRLRHNSRSKCTASRRSAAATAAFSGFAEFSAVLRCKSPFKGSVFRAWLIFNHRYTYPAMLLPPYLSVQNIYICPLSPLNIFLSPFARPASAYIYSGGGRCAPLANRQFGHKNLHNYVCAGIVFKVIKF